MNNITKNLLLGLTLVCVIVLVIFCIQLIVINRGVEPIDSGATVSGGAQQDGDDADPDSGEDGENPFDGEGADGGFGFDDDGFGGIGDPADNAPLTPRPPPQGTRESLLVAENTRLIVYYREDMFDFMAGDTEWWLIYNGDGEATLEIAYEMVLSQDIGAHAEAFLNNYSDSTTAEYAGERMIQDSLLRGYHVVAQVGSGTYEAWIHNLEGSDLSLVFVIFYQNDFQKDALYELLSSLDIERMGE